MAPTLIALALELLIAAEPVPRGEPPPRTAILRHTDKDALPSDSARFLSSQVHLLTSTAVLQQALRRPEVVSLPVLKKYPDPVGWLQANLWVNLQGEKGLIRVRLQGCSVQEQTVLLKALVGAFLEASKDEQTVLQRRRLVPLQKQREDCLIAIGKVVNQIEMLRRQVRPQELPMTLEGPERRLRLHKGELDSIERAINEEMEKMREAPRIAVALWPDE